MSATNSHADWPWCKAKHCWRSVDAHFHSGAGSMSLSPLLINAAYNTFITVCIQLPLRLPKMQDQKSLTHRWLSFSAWGWECVSHIFEYKGGQYIRNGQWCNKVNLLQLAVGYLNATINRNTQKPLPGIGTDGSTQTRHNMRVGGYGSGWGVSGRSRFNFWTSREPNPTATAVPIPTVRGLPGPIANTSLSIIIWFLPDVVKHILSWRSEDVIRRDVAAATAHRHLGTRCAIGLLATINDSERCLVVE